MNLKNSQFLIVLSSLIFVVLLAALVFGIYDIRLKNKKTSLLLNEARQLTEVGGLSKSIRTIQNNYAADLEAFDEIVLVADKLVPLIESIEEKGRQLNLETNIASVERKEGDESSTPDLIRMAIEAKGSWVSTTSFLHAIESLPHRVMIDESNLSKTEGGWQLRIVLSVQSFD